ncbi:UDP-3-O-(3-hydroxymyristoyl)glucosamine N-acyltransferase [Arcobacter lanthieri]|uniref:UDP-3-O-(3-hydroxymyristoyl)glucosamine N-acyltransferase n=1 Tax=Aliarcobacter lanthieri TaxID=1355374 RepID=UPI001922F509|nr:UDP-3-O-(3-hydroxymyristoyl)glucosamine N-acyltransferase [Aliarcobacter lanthieri]MBL3520070.1 UDP-3-O-(3-hydroxymyristoyl)glucosamine N-acyltransferase [Aliarcobacter lanthieri]
MTLKEISQFLGIDCQSDKEIKSLNSLNDATEYELTFLENKKYINDLKNTKAGAILVNSEHSKEVPQNCVALICEEPYLALAKVSKLFAPKLIEIDGENPKIGKNPQIMPNVYLGKNSNIGDNCTIMSGSFIGDNVTIGNNTIIYPNVTIYRDCIIGNDCIVHAGTVIGSDGFGFANTKDGKYIKIYQNGNVIIGSDVEIGANCTIDRAVFKSTTIDDGVRIDNLVHIAHNCKIGKGCILVTQVGLSGSTTLHHYVVMGGQSATSGHLEIAPFTTIAARGGVTKSITEPKKAWAGFPLFEHKQWLRLQGKISNLLK